ncbi:MAG: class I tRNA ligase family protein, partial [Nitrospinota bacterium]|nr:class I tRNA ligase family protein [Nitrospinota bacterium]
LKEFDFSKTSVERDDLELTDKWILSRLNRTINTTRTALDAYRFNEAAGAMYQFIWGELCDWYVEMIKPRLAGDEPGGDAARHTLAHVMETTLRLLSPVMPFITEELWQRFKPAGDSIVHARYPEADMERMDEEAEGEMGAVMEVTTVVRNIRGELGIKPSQQLQVVLEPSGAMALEPMLRRQLPFINRLARIDGRISTGPRDIPENKVVGVARGVEVYVDLSGLTGADERRAKLEKELAKVDKEIAFFSRKLMNRGYVDGAPPEVVAKDREKLEGYKADAEKMREHLKAL